MKKFVVVVASLTLCVSLAGCEDQQQEVQPTLDAVVTANSGADRPRFNGSDCVGSGGDCLPPTPPIHPTGGRSTGTYPSPVASFDNIMLESASVAKYFTGKDWQTTFPELVKKENADALQAFRSGAYYFIKYRSPESGKLFYIAGQKDKDVGLANHDFVIPVTE